MGAILRQPDDDAFYVVHGQAVVPAQREECVQRSLDGISREKGLDGRLVDKEPAAQSGHHFLGLWCSGKGYQHVMLAIEHVLDTGKPCLDHEGRSDAITGAHPGKVEGFLDVFGIPIPAPDTGDLLGRVGEHIAHPFFIQASQRGSGSSAAKGGAAALRAVVRDAHQVRSQGQEKTATEIVAKCDSSEQLRA